MTPPRVLVVVPAHNEEQSLPATLAEVRGKVPGVDLLVVDDGSRDGTAGAARAAGVPVLRHAVNLGVGAALQTGFRWAYEHGYDIAVQLDADGQPTTDPHKAAWLLPFGAHKGYGLSLLIEVMAAMIGGSLPVWRGVA